MITVSEVRLSVSLRVPGWNRPEWVRAIAEQVLRDGAAVGHWDVESVTLEEAP